MPVHRLGLGCRRRPGPEAAHSGWQAASALRLLPGLPVAADHPEPSLSLAADVPQWPGEPEGRGFRRDAACGFRLLRVLVSSSVPASCFLFVHGGPGCVSLPVCDYPLAVLCTWSKVEGKEESSVIGGGGSPCTIT